MSTQTPDGVYSFPAGADLSAQSNKYRGVVINTSGEVVLAGAGAVVHGILQNNPAQGEQARVQLVAKVLKARAGTGGVTVGARTSALATGTFGLSVTSTHSYVGIALDAVAAGAAFRMLVVSPQLGAVA